MPKGRGASRGKKRRRVKPSRRAGDPLAALRSDTWLYHGTSMDVAWRAAEEGLKPGVEGCVFMAASRELALRYAEVAGLESESGKGALLKIRRSSLPDLRTTAEPRFTYPGFGRTTMPDDPEFIVSRPVPSGSIESMEVVDLDWIFETVDEEDHLSRRRLEWDGYLESKRRDMPLGPFLVNDRAGIRDELEAIEVAGAGVRLLESGLRANPVVLLAFALLSCPDGDCGEGFARRCQGLPPDGVDLFAQAVDLCRAGGDSDDPTVGGCLDAFLLTRPGTVPGQLSTVEARSWLGSADLPRAGSTDWGWLNFKFRAYAGLWEGSECLVRV